MKILAATDFSTRSHSALRRAGLLARDNDADLVLVHVVDNDQPSDLVEIERHEAQKYLEEQIGSVAELEGLRCRPIIALGEPFDGLLRVASSVEANLIVMGAHRKQILRDIFIGTTIERVIRTGPYPVLMVNAAVECAYRNVAAAVDMSESSIHAIKTGEALGLIGSANLTYIHGFDVALRGKMSRSGIGAVAIKKHAAEEQLRIYAELVTSLEANGVKLDRSSLWVRELVALEAITEAVREVQPDLLIIGTHGRSGILKVLLGSVTEEVLRSIDVDILAVPPVR